jgi:hypothetical protein
MVAVVLPTGHVATEAMTGGGAVAVVLNEKLPDVAVAPPELIDETAKL